MPKKEDTAIRKKINQMYEENEYANLQQNKNRARSITVGTAFGGAIEVNMRGDYHSLWCILNPVEAVELLEQLAAKLLVFKLQQNQKMILVLGVVGILQMSIIFIGKVLPLGKLLQKIGMRQRS